MRLVVNDIAASTGGALSVLLDFYNFLVNDKEAKKIEWIFLLSGEYIQPSENIQIQIFPKKNFNWIKRIWFDNITIKNICEFFNADGVISLQNTICPSIKQPQLVYMHNVLPFQKEKMFSFFKREERIYAIYQHIIGRIIRRSVRKADIVVVQAEWLKRLISEETNVELDKILVNPIVYNKYSPEAIIEDKFDNTSFFYPAFECVYKNQTVIRKACELLEEKGLALSVYLTVSRNKKDSKYIYPIGRISHEAVMSQYSKSTLIFPSYIETVGLPLIEAMSRNAIILAADCQYAHETLSGYKNAYFFNAFDPVELADLMMKVVTGKIIKYTMVDSLYRDSEKVESGWSFVISKFLERIRRT